LFYLQEETIIKEKTQFLAILSALPVRLGL